MSKHILVIEDTEDLGEMIYDILSMSGYKVTWAKDGNSGIDLFFKVDPDLVLTDLIMPQVSGLDITKAIRSSAKSTVPVVILTARVSPEDQALGLATGANSYLKKPCSSTLLIKTIKSLIDQS